MAVSTFYAIWEVVDRTTNHLDLLDGGCRVVDAIYAVNDVRRQMRRSTLTNQN